MADEEFLQDPKPSDSPKTKALKKSKKDFYLKLVSVIEDSHREIK